MASDWSSHWTMRAEQSKRILGIKMYVSQNTHITNISLTQFKCRQWKKVIHQSSCVIKVNFLLLASVSIHQCNIDILNSWKHWLCTEQYTQIYISISLKARHYMAPSINAPSMRHWNWCSDVNKTFFTRPRPRPSLFGRLFVKRFALRYQTVVLSVWLSVTLVYCGQTVGQIKMKLATR